MEIKAVSRRILKECDYLGKLMLSKKESSILAPPPCIIFAPTDKDGRLGYYDGEQNAIVLSEDFLYAEEKSEEEATFLHELAHAIDYKKRGCSRHDEYFRALCLSIGVPSGFEKAKVRTNHEKREKARNKVAKLIRLSSSPFENESTEALKMAQRLMAEYGIKEEKDAEVKLYSAEIDSKTRFYFHEKIFVSIITRLSGVLILREKRDTQASLNAYGTIEQVEFAYETYLFLHKALKDAYKREKDGSIDYFSYAAGLSSKLYERIEKEGDGEVSKALSMINEDNRRKFKEIFTSSRISGRRTKTSFQSMSAYERGSIASRSISIPKDGKVMRIKKIENKR